MRIDVGVDALLSYVTGRSNLIKAKAINIEKNKSECEQLNDDIDLDFSTEDEDITMEDCVVEPDTMKSIKREKKNNKY